MSTGCTAKCDSGDTFLCGFGGGADGAGYEDCAAEICWIWYDTSVCDVKYDCPYRFFVRGVFMYTSNVEACNGDIGRFAEESR